MINFFQTTATLISTAYIALIFETKYFKPIINDTNNTALHQLKSFIWITISAVGGLGASLFFIFNMKYERLSLWLNLNALIFLFIYIIRLPIFDFIEIIDSKNQSGTAIEKIDHSENGELRYNKSIKEFGLLVKIATYEEYLYPLLFFIITSLTLHQYIILLFFIPYLSYLGLKGIFIHKSS